MIPLVGLIYFKTGLVFDGPTQGYKTGFGCLDPGDDMEFGYGEALQSWGLTYVILTGSSLLVMCGLFAFLWHLICWKNKYNYSDGSERPGKRFQDTKKLRLVRDITIFGFALSVGGCMIPVLQARAQRWISWGTWTQIGLTGTGFPVLLIVLHGLESKVKSLVKNVLIMLGAAVWLAICLSGILVINFLVDKALVSSSENATNFEFDFSHVEFSIDGIKNSTLNGNDGAEEITQKSDTKSLGIFLWLALMIFITQLVVRCRRKKTWPLPWIVEGIIFASILDLISDIIYTASSEFWNKELKAAAIVFCVMPFGILIGLFITRCYRLVTIKNLQWRTKVSFSAFTKVPGWLHYTLIYPVMALALSILLLVVLVGICMPIEAVLPLLELIFIGGVKEAWKDAKQTHTFAIDLVARQWGALGALANKITKYTKEIYAKTCFMLIPIGLMYGLLLTFTVAILGLVLVMTCVLYFGVMPILFVAVPAYWALVSICVPFIWSLMVMLRVFAIFPDTCTWLENQCDVMMGSMSQMDDTGLFQYTKREIAGISGQDLGVFQTFHPTLEPGEDPLPVVDNQAVFFYISGTIVVEFLLETLPQILIQVINNSKWNVYCKNHPGCNKNNPSSIPLDATDGELGSELGSGSGNGKALDVLAEVRDAIGSGWTTFTMISILISFIVALDGIYRQIIKVICEGYKFGSVDMWDKPPPRDEADPKRDINKESEANKGAARDDGDRLNQLRTERIKALLKSYLLETFGTEETPASLPTGDEYTEYITRLQMLWDVSSMKPGTCEEISMNPLKAPPTAAEITEFRLTDGASESNIDRLGEQMLKDDFMNVICHGDHWVQWWSFFRHRLAAEGWVDESRERGNNPMAQQVHPTQYLQPQMQENTTTTDAPAPATHMNESVAETNIDHRFALSNIAQSKSAQVPQEYATLLKMALADGIIQPEEEVQLAQMRKEKGITRQQHDVAVRAMKAAPGFSHIKGAKVRCEKCKTLVHFCTCDLRRNTVGMRRNKGSTEGARRNTVDMRRNTQNESAPPVPIPREYTVGVEMALADGIIQIEEEEMLANMRKETGVSAEQHAIAIQAIENGYLQINGTEDEIDL
jgi:hypothetical protein